MRMLTKTMTRILFKEKENRLYNIFEKMAIIFGILSGVGRVIWGLIRKQAISTSPGSSIRKINNGLFWLLLVFLCLAIISMIFMLVFGTYRFNVARNNFVLTQIKIPRIENANCGDLVTIYI